MDARTIAGRFRLDEALSDRPTGKVWRAWDLRENRPTAVKTLLSAPSIEERVRFLREGAALKKLEHPNIARHVESGVDEHHGRFIVTEWVDGEDLETYLRRGPADLLTGLDIALKLAAGLSHIHGRGLLHRDLKPANIRFDSQSGCIKLIDFGLARSFGAGAETTVTEPGRFLGTPRYVSPEQARGEPRIDPRSDVFSLGGILYRCFSGRPAFDACNLQGLLHAILYEPHLSLAEAVPELPPRLTDLVDSMLEKDPETRPAHGQAVLDALDELGASFRLRAVESSDIDWGRPHIHRWQLRAQIDARAAPFMTEPALSKVAQPFGVRVAPSGPSTWSLEHDPGCEAVEAAQRVARCALAVVEAWPRTGGFIAASERAATPIRAAVRGGAFDGIELDEDMARILFATFDIGLSGHRRVLLGARPGIRLQSRGSGVCAGRGRELAALVAAFQASVAERRARTFVVEGGAGLGKTRLRFELLRQPSVLELDPFVVLCTGEHGGRFAALRALARGLRAALGLSTRFSRARLRAAFRSLVGDDATLQSAAVIESLYQALSVGGAHATTLLDTTLSWDDCRLGVLELARKLLAQQPVLVVIDDAPDVDAPSLRLVDDMLRTFSSEPLFVAAFARPHGDIPALASLTHGASERIDLSPLDVESARAMIRPRLGEDAPTAEVERLALLSGGNPRVAEELLEAAQLGGCEAPGPVLDQWFESCLLSLRRHERAILRAASVFGERYPKSGVRRILGDRISLAELDDGFERLAALTLVRPATEDEDDGWWRFAHPVLVKIIHAGLDSPELRTGHRVAGEHLALDASDAPAIVAEHFLTAQEPRAAAIWCHRAARHALRAEDLNGALDLAARGLAVAIGDDAIGELLLIEAEAKLWLGDPLGATTAVRRAMELLARATPAWVHAASILSSAALRSGDHSVHRGLAAEAEELLKDHYVS
ncbi:MAG: protein kinase, partial [Myxococcales bacterium]|nr:protein kinase [Myxococcales bacterium]